MKAKEYLSQAPRLDQRINSKLEQVAALNTLAAKATSTITGMPRNPSPAASRLEEVVSKIIDLEAEINEDIDDLVDLKTNIVKMVKQIDNPEYQILLEKRYLCFKPWEQIAVDMGYSIRYLFKKHAEALDAFDKVLAEAGII